MKRLGLFMTVIMILCITVNAQKQSNRTLVAYFSETGTTEKAAKQIAEVTGGALYEIQPAKKYTSADLDWHDKSSRSSVEMADASSRPALRSQPQNLAAYDTIYIGFPIWWNLAPRIINSFIEKGDFTGKILIPFATSGGSRISNAEQELKKAYPSLNWQKGRLMNILSYILICFGGTGSYLVFFADPDGWAKTMLGNGICRQTYAEKAV